MIDRLYKARVRVDAGGVGAGGVSVHVGRITDDSFVTNCPEAITSGGAYAMQADGGDLIVTSDEAGNNRLALDIVKCSLNATPALSDVLLHVENGAYSDATTNYRWLWWGHATSQSQPARDEAYGQDAVYESSNVLNMPMREGSGLTAYDRTANANDGTLIGGPTWAAGRDGLGALSFDGTDDYVNTNSNTLGNFGLTDFSASVWISMPVGGTYRVIVDKTVSNLFSGWHLYVATSGKLAGVCRGGGSYVLSDSRVDDGNWHFVTMVRDGSNGSAYVDGALQSTTVSNWNIDVDTSVDLYVGDWRYATGGPFAGTLDDIRIYNRALTATEIAAQYLNDSTPTWAVVEARQDLTVNTAGTTIQQQHILVA